MPLPEPWQTGQGRGEEQSDPNQQLEGKESIGAAHGEQPPRRRAGVERCLHPSHLR